ncbi:Alpha/beta hydrolase family protein [Pseudomonas syringae pv. atrofaciens]|nr:Alpha/beta hydrolase family protein [Pseudomonas syringae pv. atrofaciens]
MRDDRLAGGNTAENAARVIGQETLWRHLVAVLGATLGNTVETGTDFHALDRVDAHQRMGEFSVQTIEDRLAETRHHAFCDHGDFRTDRVLITSQLVHVGFQFRHLVRVGAEKRIVLYRIPGLERDLDRAQLAHVAANDDALACQILLGNRACSHTHGGFPCRTASATAVVADAELVVIGVIGVGRAEQVLDRRIVFGFLIGVADQQADGGAGGLALEDTRENLDLIGLLTLRGVAAGARLTPVQVALQVLQVQLQPRRAAVDDSDQRRAVAFAGGGDSEQLAESVAGHAGAPKNQPKNQIVKPSAPVYAGSRFSSSSNLLSPRASKRDSPNDGLAMLSGISLLRVPNALRLLALPITLILSLATATASAAAPSAVQRPISVDTENGKLYGTLLMPRSDKPVPVVLIVAGSGPTDRDGNNPEGGRNDSMKRLAVILASNNIASVRYDKRGVAASKAVTPDERNLSVERYVADVQLWARALKANPRLGQLILLGHSEGALVATLAAEKVGAAALISVAGTGRPVDQVLREQFQERLPPDLLQRSDQLLDELKAGKTDDNVPAELEVVFRPSVQPYLISLFRQDPAAAFGALHIPALIVQGRNDIQVGVGDALLLQKAKPDAQLALIDGMNHVLRIVPDDLQQQLLSYRNPTQPLASEVTERILSFIKALPHPEKRSDAR